MLVVMDKSTYEEHLSQPLQANIKQFKVAVLFLIGYNGKFNVTNSNNKFYFIKSIADKDGYIQNTIPLGAYEIENLNKEIKRIINDEEHYTGRDYPFLIKPSFSTLGSIIKTSNQRPVILFVPNDSMKILLRLRKSTIFEEYNHSPNPIDVLSFDNIFRERDIAQGMVFKDKRSRIIHNFTLDVDPSYKYIERFRGGVQWYMEKSKDTYSSICFKLINESKQFVSINGQSITFRLSIKEV